ncbi:uncharacterized protein LOC144436870 [Glandiceps talaboti]
MEGDPQWLQFFKNNFVTNEGDTTEVQENKNGPCYPCCEEQSKDTKQGPSNITPMDRIVSDGRKTIIKEEFVRKFIKAKWERFGRRLTIKALVLDFAFVITWSFIAIWKREERACYDFPVDSWRVVVWCLVICYTIYLCYKELSEFIRPKRDYYRWKEQKQKLINHDKKNHHPRWESEKAMLENQEEEVKKLKPSYRQAQDIWNYFNWITYLLITTCTILHLIDVNDASLRDFCYGIDDTGDTGKSETCTSETDEDRGESIYSIIHIRLFAVTIIFVWIRLFKSLRVLPVFSLIIGKFYLLLKALFLASILFIVFYFAFVCAFMLMFCCDVEGYGTLFDTMFSLVRLSVVDDYNYEGLKCKAPIMTDILVAGYLLIVAVIVVHFVMAAITETLIRDSKGRDIAIWQSRAEFITHLEADLPAKDKLSPVEEYEQYEAREKYEEDTSYDDDYERSFNNVLSEVSVVTQQQQQLKQQVKEQYHSIMHVLINTITRDSKKDQDLGRTVIEPSREVKPRREEIVPLQSAPEEKWIQLQVEDKIIQTEGLYPTFACKSTQTDKVQKMDHTSQYDSIPIPRSDYDSGEHADQDIFRALSAMRQQLQGEESGIQQQLHDENFDEYPPVRYRRHTPQIDVFDLPRNKPSDYARRTTARPKDPVVPFREEFQRRHSNYQQKDLTSGVPQYSLTRRQKQNQNGGQRSGERHHSVMNERKKDDPMTSGADFDVDALAKKNKERLERLDNIHAMSTQNDNPSINRRSIGLESVPTSLSLPSYGTKEEIPSDIGYRPSSGRKTRRTLDLPSTQRPTGARDSGIKLDVDVVHKINKERLEQLKQLEAKIEDKVTTKRQEYE